MTLVCLDDFFHGSFYKPLVDISIWTTICIFSLKFFSQFFILYFLPCFKTSLCSFIHIYISISHSLPPNFYFEWLCFMPLLLIFFFIDQVCHLTTLHNFHVFTFYFVPCLIYSHDCIFFFFPAKLLYHNGLTPIWTFGDLNFQPISTHQLLIVQVCKCCILRTQPRLLARQINKDVD